MVKKKIKINTKATREIDKYPLVSVYWLDICSDSSWQSLEGCKKAKLPICVTKGHLLTQTKGVTRIFGDYSLADEATGKITANPPEGIVEQAKRSVIEAGLDFGAVDVIYNVHHKKAYVLEVNTAPGLEGTTLEVYARAISNFFR